MAYAILGADDPAALRPEPAFESLGLYVPPAPALNMYFDAVSEFRPPFFANAFRHPELLKLPEVAKWIPYQNLSLVTGGAWQQPPFEAKLLPEFSGGYKFGSVAMVSLPLGVDPKPYFDRLIERIRNARCSREPRAVRTGRDRLPLSDPGHGGDPTGPRGRLPRAADDPARELFFRDDFRRISKAGRRGLRIHAVSDRSARCGEASRKRRADLSAVLHERSERHARSAFRGGAGIDRKSTSAVESLTKIVARFTFDAVTD